MERDGGMAGERVSGEGEGERKRETEREKQRDRESVSAPVSIPKMPEVVYCSS